MTDGPSKGLSRRDALKLLGAAAGATALANLPSRWSTPALVAGVLPAHAQTSFSLTCGFVGTLEWDDDVDLDLLLIVPVSGIFLVTPKPFPIPIPQGTFEPVTGTSHSGDAMGGAGSSETVTVPSGGLINGLWAVLVYNPSDVDVPVRIIGSGPCFWDIEASAPPGVNGIIFEVEDCQGTCLTGSTPSLSPWEF